MIRLLMIWSFFMNHVALRTIEKLWSELAKVYGVWKKSWQQKGSIWKVKISIWKLSFVCFVPLNLWILVKLSSSHMFNPLLCAPLKDNNYSVDLVSSLRYDLALLLLWSVLPTQIINTPWSTLFRSVVHEAKFWLERSQSSELINCLVNLFSLAIIFEPFQSLFARCQVF